MSIAQVCESTCQSVMGIPPDSLRMGMAFPFERDDASPTPQGPPQSHSPSPSTYPALTLLLTQEEQEDPSSTSPSIGNPRTPPTERPTPPLPLSTPLPPPLLSTIRVVPQDVEATDQNLKEHASPKVQGSSPPPYASLSLPMTSTLPLEGIPHLLASPPLTSPLSLLPVVSHGAQEESLGESSPCHEPPKKISVPASTNLSSPCPSQSPRRG